MRMATMKTTGATVSAVLVAVLLVVGGASAQQQACNDITNTHTISDLENGATGEIPYTDCSILNGDLFISCTTAVAVEDLEVLRNVERITGSVTIQNCPNLVNLDGLRSLKEIGGDLAITNNNLLENLHGLERVMRIDGAVSIFRNPTLCYIDLMRFERVAASVEFVQLPNCLETQCDASCTCGYCGGPDECLRSCDDPSLAWVAAPVVAGVLLIAAIIAFIVIMCKRGDCQCDCFCTLTDPIEIEMPDGTVMSQVASRKASQQILLPVHRESQYEQHVSFASGKGQAAGVSASQNGQQQQGAQPRLVMPPPRVAHPVTGSRGARARPGPLQQQHQQQQQQQQQVSSPAAAPSAIRLPRLRPQGQRAPIPRQDGRGPRPVSPKAPGSPKTPTTPRAMPPMRPVSPHTPKQSSASPGSSTHESPKHSREGARKDEEDTGANQATTAPDQDNAQRPSLPSSSRASPAAPSSSSRQTSPKRDASPRSNNSNHHDSNSRDGDADDDDEDDDADEATQHETVDSQV